MINWNKNNYWHGEDQAEASSLILDLRHSTKSARRIYTIEKNIILVIGLVIIVFVVSLLDILALRTLLLTAVSLTYTMIITSLLIAIGALIFMLRLLLRSRRTLDDWADMFERNSIKAGMSISMANKSKEEVVRAIAETMEEIGEPLREYISSKENFNEFIDVSIDKEIVFDVLIDAHRLQLPETKSDDYSIIQLKLVMNQQGRFLNDFDSGPNAVHRKSSINLN